MPSEIFSIKPNFQLKSVTKKVLKSKNANCQINLSRSILSLHLEDHRFLIESKLRFL
jgi:hypothetical protein